MGSIKKQAKQKEKRERPEVALGEILREIRTERGFSQRELAARTDLERSTIAYIELGTRQASMPTFLELCRALEVMPSEVMGKYEERVGFVVGESNT